MTDNLLLNYRRAVIVVVHLTLWAMAFLGAIYLRFDFSLPEHLLPRIAFWGSVLLGLRCVTSVVFGSFRGLWRYTGSEDLVLLLKSTAGSSLIFGLYLSLNQNGFPMSVLVIEFLASIFLVGGLRFAIRKVRETTAEIGALSRDRKRLLIIGAGDAGEMLAREIQKSYTSNFQPLGFVDDNILKRGARIHNLPVYGSIDMIPEVARKHKIDEAVVAIPTATGKEMRRILQTCKTADISVRTIPGLNGLIDGTVRVNEIREVNIEDLLGRDAVHLESEKISHGLQGSVVLVSGAGGSIGSELCRQVARFEPQKILLVERSENALFNSHRHLLGSFPDLEVVPLICDVTDQERVDAILREHSPRVVFHAAAHKHVPMMEWNPGEAVKNNIHGSRVLADAADAHNVERFVMVSTDKAVNPTSVMGVSKRIAEIYIQTLSERSDTKFVTVRFGNVLGSAGSVIPLFKEQIQAGGPVTVTHPDMTRYFMTIPEACQLILQAGSMGEGGEIFVLDMGEPVKIVDLANDLIRLSGLTPGEDIDIEFSGIRPGEKLYEELSRDEENAQKTLHPKIYVGQKRSYAWDWVTRQVDFLLERTHPNSSPAELRRSLRNVVPEYDCGEIFDNVTPVDARKSQTVAQPAAPTVVAVSR